MSNVGKQIHHWLVTMQGVPDDQLQVKSMKYLSSTVLCVFFSDARRVQTSLVLNCSFWIVALTLCHLCYMSSRCRLWPTICWASRTTCTGEGALKAGKSLSSFCWLLLQSLSLGSVVAGWPCLLNTTSYEISVSISIGETFYSHWHISEFSLANRTTKLCKAVLPSLSVLRPVGWERRDWRR